MYCTVSSVKDKKSHDLKNQFAKSRQKEIPHYLLKILTSFLQEMTTSVSHDKDYINICRLYHIFTRGVVDLETVDRIRHSENINDNDVQSGNRLFSS